MCLVYPLVMVAFYDPRICFLGDDVLQQMALTAQWDVFLVMGHTLWTGMGACIEHTWTGIGALYRSRSRYRICIGVGAGNRRGI